MYLAQINIGKTFLDSTPTLSEPRGVSFYLTNFVTGAISIAGIVLLFLLIGGGIGMITGAGKNDPKTVESGKKAATSALIGFIVVFSAYWIVKLIETITGLKLISM